MEIDDYNKRNCVLTVRRKNGKDYSAYLFSKKLQEQMARWLDEHEYFEHGKGYDNRMFFVQARKTPFNENDYEYF